MPNTIKKFPVKSLLTFPKDHIRSADTFVELMFEKSVCMFKFFIFIFWRHFKVDQMAQWRFRFFFYFVQSMSFDPSCVIIHHTIKLYYNNIEMSSLKSGRDLS